AFTATLETAVATRWIVDRTILSAAAQRLALDQDPEGFWPFEGEDDRSSPAAYGRALATFLARPALAAADPNSFRDAVRRADIWLSRQQIESVTDASIRLLYGANQTQSRASAGRTQSIELLLRAQSRDGGWGPLASSPPEPFDTAL